MNVAQAILLLIIVVAVGAGIWLWSTWFATQSTSVPPTLHGGLKVEAVSASNSNLYIYLRNIGYTPLTLDKIYVWDSRGRLVAVYNASTLSLLVWGGDVWDVSSTVHLVERGLIFYEDFDSNLNTKLWEVRANENAEKTMLSVSNGYLNVTVASKERGKWATYGVFTRSPISLPDSYVFEVELVKNGSARWHYAVCFYIMSTNKHNNPYYNIPWLAAKLYPLKGSTWAEVVYHVGGMKPQYEPIVKWWGYVEARARMIVVVKNGFVERTIVLKMYRFVGEDEWHKDRIVDEKLAEKGKVIQAVKGKAYLALTVDNPTTYPDKGLFNYIKIYKSTSFTIEGLKPGEEYTLAGSKGSCTIKVDAGRLTIDPLNPPPGCEWLQEEYYEHGYPMNIKISSKLFGILEPYQLKTLVFRVDLPPGTYTIKVTTREGLSATATVFIRGS
ncbi:MAG TPA: hypothetical protein EYH26_03245 [Pyrodictium sp.]|nr:hypothetical protein [Pyrodictium sp.]